MSNDVLSLILGGGRGEGLWPLTDVRGKPAVPLAAKYRLIDVPLSNLINSGLRRVYVLTQFLAVSLHRHITNAYKFDPFGHGFVTLLHAQQTNEATDWYRGTADAVRQQVRYVLEDPCQEVLILPGDQLYRMDFNDLLRTHRDSAADVTLAAAPVWGGLNSGWGMVRPDAAGRVAAFAENPQTPGQLEPLRLTPGWLASRGHPEPDRPFLASMGIYVFRRETLLSLLEEHADAVDFGLEVFPRIVATHRLQAHVFDGYWNDLATVGAYHEANLALAGPRPPLDFHSPEGPIYTRARYLPPARVGGALLTDALVGDGCVIEAGASLERCVVGLRTRVGRNATLRDTVVTGSSEYETESRRAENARAGLPPLGVGDDAVIERAVLDRNCRIGRGVHVVNQARRRHADGDNYVIRDGIVVIPAGAVVPDGAVI